MLLVGFEKSTGRKNFSHLGCGKLLGSISPQLNNDEVPDELHARDFPIF
jgi:hypothetical protein